MIDAVYGSEISAPEQVNFLNLALDAIAQGWHVFPCIPDSKKPLVKNGYKDAITEFTIIYDWSVKFPNANIGIVPGLFDKLVLDVDGLGKVGVASLRSLDPDLAAAVEDGGYTGRLHGTPSGGYHHLRGRRRALRRWHWLLPKDWMFKHMRATCSFRAALSGASRTP